MRTACAPWRHRRVWLAPALGAQDIRAGTGAVQAFIARAQQGLAVVGRSANADDIPGWRPLGLALARAPDGTAAGRRFCWVWPPVHRPGARAVAVARRAARAAAGDARRGCAPVGIRRRHADADAAGGVRLGL